jgi:hypothetical protein
MTPLGVADERKIVQGPERVWVIPPKFLLAEGQYSIACTMSQPLCNKPDACRQVRGCHDVQRVWVLLSKLLRLDRQYAPIQHFGLTLLPQFSRYHAMPIFASGLGGASEQVQTFPELP